MPVAKEELWCGVIESVEEDATTVEMKSGRGWSILESEVV